MKANTMTLAGEILALAKAAGRGQCPKRPCPLPENVGQRQNGPVPSEWGGTTDCAVFRLGGQDRFGYWPPSRALRRPPWRSHQRYHICVHDHLGFTIVEVIVVTLILGMALAAAVSGWLYVFRGERMSSVQHELDMNVRSALERLRADMRLSSIEKMYFYPAGPGPYTAISMPLARDDDGDGLIEMDDSGKVIWDQTVIYHVWVGTPNELRKTIFDPRNTNRTPVEMQTQLDSVVATGNGSATYDSSTATTVPIFKNFFDWKMYGKGAQYKMLSLKEFTGQGDGEACVADFGATITQTPSNGVFEMLLDGSNVIKHGIKIDMTIFQQVRGLGLMSSSTVLTSSVSAEVEPINAGK